MGDYWFCLSIVQFQNCIIKFFSLKGECNYEKIIIGTKECIGYESTFEVYSPLETIVTTDIINNSK